MANAYLDQLFGLSGKVAVVIGGTGVLGGAFCRGLAQAGAKVIVAGRSEERGNERVKEIASLGGEAAFAAVDVSSRESIQALLDHTVKIDGRVDILVNGAGVNSATSYFEVADEDWDRVIDSNLKAVHWGCQIFGKQMADAGGGAIVNIGSVTAHLPLSRVFAYSASKAAVVNLTQKRCSRISPQQRASQRALSGLLSRRTKPQSAHARTRGIDHEPNSDGSLWRTGRVDWRAAVACRTRRKFRHGHGRLCRRRFYGNAILIRVKLFRFGLFVAFAGFLFDELFRVCVRFVGGVKLFNLGRSIRADPSVAHGDFGTVDQNLPKLVRLAIGEFEIARLRVGRAARGGRLLGGRFCV